MNRLKTYNAEQKQRRQERIDDLFCDFIGAASVIVFMVLLYAVVEKLS